MRRTEERRIGKLAGVREGYEVQNGSEGCLIEEKARKGTTKQELL